jgi:phosphoribosylaminoimidazole (AIR) synthetase
MGVGFCVVTPSEASADVLAKARSDGKAAWVMGQVSEGPKEVRLHPLGLVGRGNHFTRS